jgi:hypothetical protein
MHGFTLVVESWANAIPVDPAMTAALKTAVVRSFDILVFLSAWRGISVRRRTVSQ